MSTSNKMEDYENLAKLIAKGEQIPESLLPLLLEVYESSTEMHSEDSNIVVPKEYELKYAGKDRKEEILSTTKAAPLQKVRTFRNGKESADTWENKLILGDNLKILKTLSDDVEVKGKVKLIYIDPPFATKQDFKKGQERAYTDKVIGAKFVEFLRARLILMRELLSDDGVIYVHLDEKKSHYIKVIMDEVFGEDKFQREIIWDISVLSGFKTIAPNWVRGHDTILYYSKTNNFKFNKLSTEHRQEYLDRFNKVDKDGKKYFDGRGEKKYLDDVILKGKRIGDVWGDIMSFQQIPTSKEKVGYPTQKPEALLDRIIRASSDEGDLVLDAFAGSGTTVAVAEKLGRRWIGIDCGKLAMYTVQSRLLNLTSEIGSKGKMLKHKPFAVFNAGLYDYKAIEAMDFSAYRKFILQLFQVRDKKHQINGVEVDGLIKTRSVLIWKHKDEKNLTINEDYLQSLHDALGGKGGPIFYIVAPNSAFSFPEDGKYLGETEYRFLRIPQSIIDELIASQGASLVQPRSAGNINDTVEALAFDFIKTPEVKRTLKIVKPREEHLLNQGSKMGLIKISKFESKGLGKPSNEDDDELDYLAMVMIDKDYKGQIFNLGEVVFAENVKNGEVHFDFEEVGKDIMVIYLDIYGNEFREVISASNFKESK